MLAVTAGKAVDRQLVLLTALKEGLGAQIADGDDG